MNTQKTVEKALEPLILALNKDAQTDLPFAEKAIKARAILKEAIGRLDNLGLINCQAFVETLNLLGSNFNPQKTVATEKQAEVLATENPKVGLSPAEAELNAQKTKADLLEKIARLRGEPKKPAAEVEIEPTIEASPQVVELLEPTKTEASPQVVELLERLKELGQTQLQDFKDFVAKNKLSVKAMQDLSKHLSIEVADKKDSLIQNLWEFLNLAAGLKNSFIQISLANPETEIKE